LPKGGGGVTEDVDDANIGSKAFGLGKNLV